VTLAEAYGKVIPKEPQRHMTKRKLSAP